jgi:hypothetical protein
MRVAKTSNAGEIDRNCFPNRSNAFPAPLSVSSGGGLDQETGSQHQLRLTLKEQWKEGNREYQEDADDTACDPVKDWSEEVATPRRVQQLATGIELANDERRVQRPHEDHCKYGKSAEDRPEHDRHSCVTMKTWTDKMINMLLIWNPGWA